MVATCISLCLSSHMNNCFVFFYEYHIVEKFAANRLLIVSTKLDGFSLVNHGRFAKLSRYTVIVLYSSQVFLPIHHYIATRCKHQ